MFSIVTRALRLVAARWPQLLAWYLAGWLARYLLIEVAATVGANSALFGLMIMPLAILARLGSYIGMFLTLRPAMPGYSALEAAGDDAVDRTTRGPDARSKRSAKVTSILLATILPFFAFYAAWQLLAEDTAAYATSALQKINFFDGAHPTSVLSVELSPYSVGVIVLAFIGRFLIKRYNSRLPRWMNLVAVYLEAVWVYLTLFLVTNYQTEFQDWLANREAMRWLDDARQGLFALMAPLEAAWAAVQWVIGETGGIVLLPLAWLTLAGIVFGRSLAAPKLGLRAPERFSRGIRSRLAAVPSRVRVRMRELGADWVDRWRPLADALLLIWRAGVVPMGLFVLAYTVLVAATSWLDLAAVRLVGPHDLASWWMNFDGILTFVVALIVEPLRLSLVVAAYDFCLQRLGERREAVADGYGADGAVADGAMAAGGAGGPGVSSPGGSSRGSAAADPRPAG